MIAVFALPARADDIEVVRGVDGDGAATPQWLAMIRKRLPAPEYHQLEPLVKPLSPQERQWAELIESRARLWMGRRQKLAEPFASSRPPERVLVVLGNRGGDDAFTHDPSTIGHDLAVLQATYGDATHPENLRRVDRFFDHEYTHLMQKSWLAAHPYEAGTPLRAALLDIWLEGLGNYYSLSDKWRGPAGQSASALETLAELEPRFVARMSALACASPAQAKPLLRDLSAGPFAKKWGALPAALWLEAEASGDPGALRRFVAGGPDGVWGIAARHLPASLASTLEEARRAALACSADDGEPASRNEHQIR
jgi:hypothetical protein